MLDFIRKIKADQEFMSNTTSLMPELIELLNSYEQALYEYLMDSTL